MGLYALLLLGFGCGYFVASKLFKRVACVDTPNRRRMIHLTEDAIFYKCTLFQQVSGNLIKQRRKNDGRSLMLVGAD